MQDALDTFQSALDLRAEEAVGVADYADLHSALLDKSLTPIEIDSRLISNFQNQQYSRNDNTNAVYVKTKVR